MKVIKKKIKEKIHSATDFCVEEAKQKEKLDSTADRCNSEFLVEDFQGVLKTT